MRSDNVKKGSERAPNRSLFYALGYTPEELDRPLIGVISAYSEIVPGHMNLDKIADAVKAGVQMAGSNFVCFRCNFFIVAKTSAFKIVDLSISFVCVALNLIVEILSKEQSTMMA